ncbi:hypothetical protein TVAG_249530 [Trichomonas vaginalis G3]|uniref:BACK domain-containing protein n=1 Tax=Trichomonas vaginalis (strain ATCC PRA-98 / G3) TaxID=412133 RepID=A2DCF6_TRIV3|nr:protein ubiquitination [Trichomonas vaginalis G3]EAY21893.1 hypothetical protein TVAG_249530 [Trichomonas vaginalis G3]KAI5487631.1 protein ubiquitination [Trichomonas vaginalis G3]|eukprot:XP_001582879.1 hypothetical protein [Trichomonas vaginalis G3]
MVQITKSCKEIKRVGILTECGRFNININGRSIKTKKSSAVCFSDLIQEKCIINKSRSSYEANLDLRCEDSIDILSEFLETGKLDFEEDESHYHDIFEIGKHFGNQLFIQLYTEHVKLDKSITKENVFQKYEISVFENDIITENECIRFISSHLYCLDDRDIIEHFAKNGYEFCEKIITSDELKIDNEDHLSLLLLSICKQNDIFFDLFRYIKLTFCSRETYDIIYNFCIEHSFERVLLSIYNETLKNYHSNFRENIEISNEPVSSFEKPLINNQFTISNNSICAYNILKASEEIKMEFTASSVENGRSLSDINSYRSDVQSCTDNHPNSWIKADLKGYKLKPISYILQSNNQNDYNLLRRWKLEGIKEDGTTVVLDNDKYYEFKQSEIKEFPLQTKEYFVSFKLTQTGKTSSDEDFLIINIFDFKGELIKI